MTPGTPARSGYSPVKIAARLGEQTVQLARMFVNNIPSFAIESMCGVCTSDGWYVDTSPYPWSSVMMIRMLGRALRIVSAAVMGGVGMQQDAAKAGIANSIRSEVDFFA